MLKSWKLWLSIIFFAIILCLGFLHQRNQRQRPPDPAYQIGIDERVWYGVDHPTNLSVFEHVVVEWPNSGGPSDGTIWQILGIRPDGDWQAVTVTNSGKVETWLFLRADKRSLLVSSTGSRQDAVSFY
jgi:hypothetical protein